ncbi:MAG TPA: PilZ domain-containing protein [Terracidiphilus sp.]|nr:PilZ domain-containing protein [Terracidiphilus sp.]
MDALENPFEPRAELGQTAELEPTAEIDERRNMPRCAADTQVTLVLLARGTMMVGRMTELGISGCRVHLPKNLANAVSTAVECTFRLRGAGFRLGGVVDWAQDSEVGLEFSTMSARSRDDLMEVLCEVELENQAKPVVPALQTTAGKLESAPIFRQAPVALPSQSPRAIQTRAVPAPVPQIASAPIQGPPKLNRGCDRRVTHRCGVDTSATIDLINVGSRLAGQIVDLSVGGCRIRTQEKFPVGIYTRVETEFKLHGLPFRLGGVIQAIHDRTTVGIRFLDMSERKKEQVAELVAEIVEPQP